MKIPRLLFPHTWASFALGMALCAGPTVAHATILRDWLAPRVVVLRSHPRAQLAKLLNQPVELLQLETAPAVHRAWRDSDEATKKRLGMESLPTIRWELRDEALTTPITVHDTVTGRNLQTHYRRASRLERLRGYILKSVERADSASSRRLRLTLENPADGREESIEVPLDSQVMFAAIRRVTSAGAF
jgi:hypothetical protein